jgi:hypothetical protein
MKFDNRSAFGPVDIVVSNARLQHVAPLAPRHKDRPAAGRAAAMLAFAARFLVAALGHGRRTSRRDPGRPPSEPARTAPARSRPRSSSRRPISLTSAPTTRAPSTRYIASSSVRRRRLRSDSAKR